MNLHDFYYDLPEELIAQHPAAKRDESRLMILHKENGSVEHKIFHDVVDYFEEGDCLVINDSRVIPARLFGSREGKDEQIEVFLLRPQAEKNVWECLVKPGKKMKVGTKINISDVPAEVLSITDEDDPDYADYAADLQDMKEKLSKMESSLWDTALMITRLSSTKCSERLKRAMDMFAAGDNKGAQAVLNEEEIERDVEHNLHLIQLGEEGRNGLKMNVEEYELKIKPNDIIVDLKHGQIMYRLGDKTGVAEV